MRSIKYQTLKKIGTTLNITREQAQQVRGLITGKIPTGQYKSVVQWVRQCYNEPTIAEKRMVALNEIIGGYGVEVGRNFAYVNMGDTYATTIIRCGHNAKYVVSSMGDMVEYYRGD
jgi:hypothetical protein